MAASLSAEQVLGQICEKGEEEEAPYKEKGITERLKVGLCSAVKDGEVDTVLFVSSCTRIVESLYHLCCVGVRKTYGEGARAMHPLHAMRQGFG